MFLKALAAVGLLLALVGFATAEDHFVVVDDSKPGSYLLTIDAAGAVKIVGPIKITRAGKPPSPPPVDPQPHDPTAFEEAITSLTRSALTSGGSKTTGAALASVYSLVSDSVSAGDIEPDKAFESVKKGCDTVLAVQPDAAKWATFRTEVGKALTALSADGSLTTKAQIVDVLKSIADGMRVAAPAKG